MRRRRKRLLPRTRRRKTSRTTTTTEPSSSSSSSRDQPNRFWCSSSSRALSSFSFSSFFLWGEKEGVSFFCCVFRMKANNTYLGVTHNETTLFMYENVLKNQSMKPCIQKGTKNKKIWTLSLSRWCCCFLKQHSIIIILWTLLLVFCVLNWKLPHKKKHSPLYTRLWERERETHYCIDHHEHV